MTRFTQANMRRYLLTGDTPVGPRPTETRVLEAIDNMDDFARMSNITAEGPLRVLLDYVHHAEEDRHRLEGLCK